MIFIGLIVAIVLLVMLFLPTRRRTERLLNSVDADVGHDAAVLANLARAGSNLALPHPIECFLYIPRWDDAARIKAALEAEGFAVHVAAHQARWACRATKPLVPTRETIAALRARFEALAVSVGGVFDGWGTPVVR